MTDAQTVEHYAESRQNEVYSSHIAFFLLSLLALAGRFLAVRISDKKLGWDDWFTLVAGVCDIGVFACSMLWLRFGLGRHAAWAVEQDPYNLVYFFQTIMANEILYTTALACARLSIVFFYYRIFGITSMRYYLHALVCFIVAWAISTYGPSIFACWPVYDFWGVQAKCINLYSFYVGVAIGSIITDISLIVLPLPFIWRLQTTRLNKFLIGVSFFFGGFNCIVTIIRLQIVVSLDLSDPTYNTTDLMIWTGVELYCAVICCCLPHLPPLIKQGLKKMGVSNWVSVSGSKDNSKSPRKASRGNNLKLGQQQSFISTEDIRPPEGQPTELRTIGGGRYAA